MDFLIMNFLIIPIQLIRNTKRWLTSDWLVNIRKMDDVNREKADYLHSNASQRQFNGKNVVK